MSNFIFWAYDYPINTQKNQNLNNLRKIRMEPNQEDLFHPHHRTHLENL